MANARVIRNRIKSVKNTGKITKTMAMVATAKATKAVTAIKKSRPYAEKIFGVLQGLGADSDAHPLFETHEEAPRKLLIVVTANRGLCGGYNTNAVKLAMNSADVDTDIWMYGKKGASAFRFAKREMEKVSAEIKDMPEFEMVSDIADELMESYIAGKYREVSIVYTKYISAGQQKATHEKLLPFSLDTEEESSEQTFGVDPIYLPGKEELLTNLVPKAVRVTIYKCMLDASASEHLARQMAMNSASDNAGEMVKQLTLTFNRARQAQITTEISEIVGGAEALN